MESLFETTDTRVDNSDPIYFLLDTTEGSDCFGHWITECAVFIPTIVSLRVKYLSLKIILYCPRRYKLHTLIDFGFNESDIIYNPHLFDLNQYHSYVLPPSERALVFKPHFFYMSQTGIITPNYLHCVKQFQEYYRKVIGPVEKTIPILYLIRSRKENYNGPNARNFINIDDIVELCGKYSIQILNVDMCTSIREQVEAVMKAKIIIHEYGSAMINSTFYSKDSHTIILNHFFLEETHVSLMNHMMRLNGVTWDIFTAHNGTWKNFTIDISAVEQRLLELLKCKDKPRRMPVAISLGWNCYSAMQGVSTGVRLRKADGYLTCPFDECLTNYDGIIQCIRDDFKNFMDVDMLELPDDAAYMAEESLIYNPHYKFIFNHESPGHANLWISQKWSGGKAHYVANNYEKFIERYSNRIKNFRSYLNSGEEVLFIITKHDTDVNELSSVIRDKYPNLVFTIQCIPLELGEKHYYDHMKIMGATPS